MADGEEYEEEEVEEEIEEEVEESNNQEQSQGQMVDPQQKNTNMIQQPKAEDKKSINSKKSGASKVSKSKNSTNKNNTKKESTKANKTKTSEVKKSQNTYLLPTPEQVVSTRAYIEQTVSSVIQEALLELAKQRPENPLSKYNFIFTLYITKNYYKIFIEINEFINILNFI